MIVKKEVHHQNDVSVKYLKVMEGEKLHSYPNLPGKFIKDYPTKIVKRDDIILNNNLDLNHHNKN